VTSAVGGRAETGGMLEIRIHGRGGQGAQVGCQILAQALFRAGRSVQAFAAYGGERRGAPVTAYLRVADRPIRLRCDIERPHHALVLDATVLADGQLAGTLRPGGVLLVNAKAALPDPPPTVRLVTIDAGGIAERYGLGTIVATAGVGAFVGITADVNVVPPRTIERSIGKAKRVLDLRGAGE